MPFFWFGSSGPAPLPSTATGVEAKSPSVSISSHHTRKASLSLSSSGKNARLAEVRSQTTASYLQNQSIGDSSRRSRAFTSSGHGKRGGVVAIEDDDDSKHKGRIDQGLIDACNEAKLPQTKASWWSSFSVTAITPPSSFTDNTSSRLEPTNEHATAFKHRRTVSKTTYRV